MPAFKRRTTPAHAEATTEQPPQPLPDAQKFRHSLRDLALGAVRTILEQVMCEEREQCVGAAWGENTGERKGYLTVAKKV